jgi:hypothetical protein
VTLLQAGHELAHRGIIGIDLAQVSDFALSARFGDCHGMVFFGSIQSHENFAMLFHGSSPCAEARLAPASNPR